MAASLKEWDAIDGSRRLQARDASLWTGADEARWLDWLDAVERSRADLEDLAGFARDIRAQGFSHAVLLGMGGSSLCADVLRAVFPPAPSHPELIVLDSTDPTQVRRASDTVDPDRTLAIVASKSGSTLEPNVLAAHFLALTRRRSRFVVITDPGSRLEALAREQGAWRMFRGVPGIGGRYSALSPFGLVPAAVLGMDVETLLNRAGAMVAECGPDVPASYNPGVRLGIVLGEAALSGRDKLTLVVSPALRSLGAWIEQLVAESTGKHGRAIIPVEAEPVAPLERYGPDRAFVYLRLASGADPAQDALIVELERGGWPVVSIHVANTFDIAKEFFRWEVATAVAGHVLGINPFDQPDVEASKVAARALTARAEVEGALPDEQPPRLDDPQTTEKLRALLESIGPGDYFALLAWLPRTEPNEDRLRRIRARVLEATGAATTLGFGPRYLHSTGQAHKGGPNTGVFLMLTCDEVADLPIPGQRLTFGQVKAAQARGDLAVLQERGRRVLRVHLGADVERELERLEETVGQWDRGTVV